LARKTGKRDREKRGCTGEDYTDLAPRKEWAICTGVGWTPDEKIEYLRRVQEKGVRKIGKTRDEKKGRGQPR